MKSHLINPALLLTATLASGLLFTSTAVSAIDYSGNQSQLKSQLSEQNTTIDDDAQLSQAQLAQLLAPIALYPDSLLSHILIAASYPLEVVEAYRWREQQGNVSKTVLIDRAAKQEWDASVIALVPFKTVLTQMNKDLTWLRKLGDAFLAQEQEVLDSIQSLRLQAQEAGNLDSIDKVDIEYERDKIIIVSRKPEVVYVPYYDTRVVYGDWRWRHYPPVYWRHYDKYYHSHRNDWPITWHTGVHLGVGFFFSAFHWHNGYVVINHRKNFHNHYRHYNRKRHHILYSGYSKRWHHKPYHRRNVAYRTAVIKEKYRRQHSTKRYLAVSKASRHNASQNNYQRKNGTFERVKGQLNSRNSAKLLNKPNRQPTNVHSAKVKSAKVKSAQVKSVKLGSPKKRYANANNKKKPTANLKHQVRHQTSLKTRAKTTSKTHSKSKPKQIKSYARSSYKKSSHTSNRQSISRSSSRKQRQH